jgi:phosphatidylglycerophosphate synthase
VPRVRTGPLIGLFVQVILLAALSGAVGLGVAGWLAGLTYGIVTCATLSRGLYRADARSLGPADRVTLARATLVGGVTGLIADSFSRPLPVAAVVTLGAVALALDAVDGKVARRTGTVSALGARFDMEIDAFLILALSIYVARSIGAWALAIGAMRYAFVAASWVMPWMNGALPPRLWRKVVAATQGVVLVVVTSGLLYRPLAAAVVAIALALLVESFGRDVAWLWRRRPVQLAARHAAGVADRSPDRRPALVGAAGSRAAGSTATFTASRYSGESG